MHRVRGRRQYSGETDNEAGPDDPCQSGTADTRTGHGKTLHGRGARRGSAFRFNPGRPPPTLWTFTFLTSRAAWSGAPVEGGCAESLTEVPAPEDEESGPGGHPCQDRFAGSR